MKKSLLSLMLFFFTEVAYSQDIIYNCRISNDERKPNIEDYERRYIKKINESIVIYPYKNDEDLILFIDSVARNPKSIGDKKNMDWYYCTDKYEFKYIVIGIGTARVSLYHIFSELDIFEDVFSSLTEK